MSLLSKVPRRKRFRIVGRSICLVVGFIFAYWAVILIGKGSYFFAFFPSIVVFIASFAEFILMDVFTEKIYPARTEKILADLEEKIPKIEKNLSDELDSARNALKGCNIDQVSITLHLKVSVYSTVDEGSEDAFIQIIDYRGRFGGKRWRTVNATKGIIGRCLRTGKTEIVNFASEEEYDRRMVEEFSFTREEANKHTKPARSYWAHPVFSRDELVGVIYLFSNELQVFPKAVKKLRLDQSAKHIANLLEVARVI